VVVLNRIYTRTGDKGDTGLASGVRVSKSDPRVEAYGTVDELNAVIGVARLHSGQNDRIDAMLGRIQNELFDLGADLATPLDPPPKWEALRIVQSQIDRLEVERGKPHGRPRIKFGAVAEMLAALAETPAGAGPNSGD